MLSLVAVYLGISCANASMSLRQLVIAAVYTLTPVNFDTEHVIEIFQNLKLTYYEKLFGDVTISLSILLFHCRLVLEFKIVQLIILSPFTIT